MCVRGGRGMNPVIAVQPRHFFDEVRLDREVEAIRRWRHDEIVAVALRFEAEPVEYCGDLVVRDADAEYSRDACAAHANRIAPRKLSANVDQRACVAAAQLEDQGRGAIDR